MNEPAHDEQLLIDYALGQCPPAEAEAIRQRLETDEAFAALHADLSNAFGALEAYTVADPPEDLVRQTLERVRAQRRTEALVEAQPIERRVRVPMFSFRELGAVAAVLLLALGVLLPSLHNARGDANRVLCADNIRMIATGMFHYANVNNHALPAVPSKVDVWLRKAGTACASNSAALFLLVRKNYVPPGVFQCPATDGRSFTVRQGLVDFPSPRNIGYSYQHCLAGPIRRDHPDLVDVSEQYAILSEQHPVFVDGRFRPDRINREVSDNHGGSGQNVLFLDGTVKWTTHGRVGVDGDNIWLPDDVTTYVGNEKPASVTDSFLLPHTGR